MLVPREYKRSLVRRGIVVHIVEETWAGEWLAHCANAPERALTFDVGWLFFFFFFVFFFYFLAFFLSTAAS